jgi:penicillin-binding protein 1C
LRVFLTPDDKIRMDSQLSDFPPQLIEALLLKEDQYFYSHGGVNFIALARAGFGLISPGEDRPGASTLTMQLARLTHKLKTRTIPGKLWQSYLAMGIERHHSKESILRTYLNFAPFGGNLEGFTSASWGYFGKGPRALSLSEILMLVVLPQNPEGRKPLQDRFPAEAYEARDRLFQRWVEKHPEDSRWQDEMNTTLRVEPGFPFSAPHYCEFLEVQQRQGGQSGNIWSHLDSRLQENLEEQIRAYLRPRAGRGMRNAAALLIDHENMELLAAVGSANYLDESILGQVNGFTARRSPGSALKPFVYALAIEQGLIHPHTMLRDTPLNFGIYNPDNFEGDFSGPVHAWKALVQSRNIPAVALAQEIQNPDLYQLLRTAGVGALEDRQHYGLSIVLGTAEITMLELGQMYTALSRRGHLFPLHLAEDLTWGKDTPLLSEESAYLVKKILEKNPPPDYIRPGDIREISIGFKTGTSIAFKDAWTLGSFDRYTLAVWIGNFDGEGNPLFLGRSAASPLFFRIADSILLGTEKKDLLPESFAPEGIEFVEVCAVSGGIPNEHCTDTVTTGFIPGLSPIDRCDVHRQIFIDQATGYRVEESRDEGVIPVVWEFWTSDFYQLFEDAGLPRIQPPPFAPDIPQAQRHNQGFPPRITSPFDGGEYLIDPQDPQRQTIVFQAHADSEAQELFWFIGSRLIGKASPQSSVLWRATPGRHEVVVLDSQGRADAATIVVDLLP